jgi:hypothetical protein
VTVKTPFMPAAACPGTVHLYGNEPALLNVIASVTDLPGAISGDFFPAIAKSCLR